MVLRALVGVCVLQTEGDLGDCLLPLEDLYNLKYI